MSTNHFTTDRLRETSIKKYAPVIIGLSDGTEVELLSLLRLKQERRESILETIDDLQKLRDGDSEDDLSTEEYELLAESLSAIFPIIAKDHADRLLAELDHEDVEIKLDMLMQALTYWLQGAQVGEARNSLS